MKKLVMAAAVILVFGLAGMAPAAAQETDTVTETATAASEETVTDTGTQVETVADESTADSTAATFAEQVNSSFSGIFQLGADVLYTGVKGESGALALGAGADFAKFSKSLSWGGNFDVYLHGTVGAYASGSAKGGVVGGGGLNLDLVALIKGAQHVKILAKTFNLVLGGGGMYSLVHNKPGWYGLGNLNFLF